MFIRKESGNFMSRRAFPYRRKKNLIQIRSPRSSKVQVQRKHTILKNIGRIKVGGGRGQPVQYGFVHFFFGGGVYGSEAARDGDDAFSSIPESSRPSQAH